MRMWEWYDWACFVCGVMLCASLLTWAWLPPKPLPIYYMSTNTGVHSVNQTVRFGIDNTVYKSLNVTEAIAALKAFQEEK